ncbi:hypothetical protein EU524_01850 [Candidatus Thorarchaeota archaeon]|nr:MAG: hypothetical protein EU524_01850 [Candidatus Thorarchaeota archaeon]
MSQGKRSITGPLTFSIGGCIAGAPVFLFFFLLFNDRFAGADQGFYAFLLLALFMLFGGLFIASVGMQMILEDSQR